MNDNTENKKSKHPKRNVKGLVFMVVLVIGFIFISRHEPVNTVDCTPEIIANKPDVIMLGAWWCSYCYKAKRYFQENKINYCEYDMENTVIGKKLYKEHGSGAVPMMLIGQYQINGYSEQQIEYALALLNKTKNNTP
jgi:glutaredoxin